MTQEFCDIVNRTIQEYDSVFLTPKEQSTSERYSDWKQVEAKLQHEMEWTQEGASHVAALARNYGGFMLRNALALATALGIEDGSLGF